MRVEDDHLFGALVVFGLGGLGTGVLADHAARLTPLTDVDADQLIGSIRAAPLLLGQHGSESVDVGALRDLLLRVSRLADDLPEVTGSRPQPGHHQGGRRIRDRRADQGHAVPAAGPVPAQVALRCRAR